MTLERDKTNAKESCDVYHLRGGFHPWSFKKLKFFLLL